MALNKVRAPENITSAVASFEIIVKKLKRGYDLTWHSENVAGPEYVDAMKRAFPYASHEVLPRSRRAARQSARRWTS